MPYEDESFDFVVCRAAFKNFADPVGALNEIHRVLRPGGKGSVHDLRAESSPSGEDRRSLYPQGRAARGAQGRASRQPPGAVPRRFVVGTRMLSFHSC